MKSLWLIPAIVTLACCAWFLICASTVWKKNPVPERGLAPVKKLTFKSLTPLVVIIAVYLVLAFWNLGSTETPQTFASFTDGEPLTLEVGTSIGQGFHLSYFSGVDTGNYKLYASDDGINWNEVAEFEQNWVAVLKWHELELTELPPSTRFLRVSADNPNMLLGEFVLRRATVSFNIGEMQRQLFDVVPLTAADERSALLVDEQGLETDPDDWMYNSYFDEIYHPRTAYEHLENRTPYEITHPPLGKIILGIGIQAFGMNPFGWRFMGALLGIIMLIPLYVFVQNMFGKPMISASATVLLASDFMHYVQTRIGTVDTEVVLFILLMYYFMYRYVTLPDEAPLGKSALWLGLSGLAFGLGAATKWIALYGALGLAWMWAVKLFHIVRFGKKRIAESAESGAGDDESFRLGSRVVSLVLLSVLFFLVIPALVYCLSYLPYASANYGASRDGTLMGFLKMVWENQKYMLSYHGELVSEHPYSSAWYQWIVDARPILYFQWFNPRDADGMESVFGAFTNPLITWAGLAAMAYMVRLAIKGDRAAHLIFAGWLSQLLPWIFIPRIAFAYHYFPNIVFIVLALARLMQTISERPVAEIHALRNSSLIRDKNT
ncbi:MAG: glycosyltransferase family 39 protein, partial [Oscillospiraceae bacterium]|nr:glycosyltransferase family 39 protein [Oscillospiraceae bacterium]